mmetsp:Transcript_27330/g.58033  ORF Transcript_27330/g.58033 Transcript_27330/m.58033 type:complete len:298 (+) Transcript_27330:595-1488(+)
MAIGKQDCRFIVQEFQPRRETNAHSRILLKIRQRFHVIVQKFQCCLPFFECYLPLLFVLQCLFRVVIDNIPAPPGVLRAHEFVVLQYHVDPLIETFLIVELSSNEGATSLVPESLHEQPGEHGRPRSMHPQNHESGRRPLVRAEHGAGVIRAVIPHELPVPRLHRVRPVIVPPRHGDLPPLELLLLHLPPPSLEILHRPLQQRGGPPGVSSAPPPDRSPGDGIYYLPLFLLQLDCSPLGLELRPFLPLHSPFLEGAQFVRHGMRGLHDLLPSSDAFERRPSLYVVFGPDFVVVGEVV